MSIQEVGVEQQGVCEESVVDGEVSAALLLMMCVCVEGESLNLGSLAYSLPTVATFHHHIKFCRTNTCRGLQPVNGGAGT